LEPFSTKYFARSFELREVDDCDCSFLEHFRLEPV
jgi:hypothetical protein